MYATILPKCFKTTTSISQNITLTKIKIEHEYDLMSWHQYSYLLNNLDEQNHMLFKEKEMFIWSFCIIIATKIKFLEINTLISNKEGANIKSNIYQDRYFQFGQLKALIQKFVLELSEPSAARNLWPWYDNSINDSIKDLDEMRQILHHNGEYTLNSKTDIIEPLKPISVKSFNYPNIRYMRKCAANLLLNERLTCKQLFDIHKLVLNKSNEISSATSSIASPGIRPLSLHPTMMTPDLMALFDQQPAHKIQFSVSDYGNDDYEILTKQSKEYVKNFGNVLSTIFSDTNQDSKTVVLRNMLFDAMKNNQNVGIHKGKKRKPKIRFEEKPISISNIEDIQDEKEEKKDEVLTKGFKQFYNYFREVPMEFKSKKPQLQALRSKSKKENDNFNKYDLLLLVLGIEFGFNLGKIKKLLYIYKENMSWEFRQFFKVRIRVLIRMKYLCSLILLNTPKSYFHKTLITSNSIVFSDGLEFQQHLKYCYRHTKQYDVYGTPKSSKFIELRQIKKPSKSMDNNAIDSLNASHAAGMTVIVNGLSEEKKQMPDVEPVHIHEKSTGSDFGSDIGHKHGQLSIHRKRSSLNLGDEYKYQTILFEILADRDIELELRDSIHFYEQYELTDDITKYIVNKIRNKTDHRVLESLWKSLIIILSQISLVDALRLLSKHWDSIRNK
eukprot:294763_1